MAPHQQYELSGPLRVRMEDGTEVEAGNAETTAVPRTRRLGHDRRTGGDRPRDDQTIASLNHRRSPSLQAERLRALGAAVPAPAPTCGAGQGPDAPTQPVSITRDDRSSQSRLPRRTCR